jgi:hypothetical protein
LLILKILGLITVFAVSCLLGFYKSVGLKVKADRIYSLIRSLEKMAEYIRLGNLEILLLIEKCFDKELVFVKENKIYTNKDILDKESIKIIEEFFSAIGTGDKKAEYERTFIYKNMLEKEYNEAYKVYKEQGRLYNTLGVLGGLFLILFLV